MADFEPTDQRESLSEMERAQARMFDARAARFMAEAKVHDIEAASKQLDLDDKVRTERKKLTADEFHHVYQFSGDVSANSVNTCMRQLQTWVREADKPCDIELIFHSPGGSVIDGMALFDFIRSLQAQGHCVTTVALGMAASMAGILLQAGNTRVMGREAWVLIHEASFGASGSMGAVEDTVEWVKMIQKRILNIFAERSNLSAKAIGRRWKRKNWWLSSDDCVKYGFVDEVR